MLDKTDRWLQLGQLPEPIFIDWITTTGNYNATSTKTWVSLNGSTLNPSGGWEETLIHELCHVVDKQRMTDTDRNTVMSTLTRHGDNGTTLDPVWGLDGSVPYADRAGECFAETTGRHIWYALVCGSPAADLGAWGAYTFTDSIAIPAMLHALNEGTP